MKHIKCALALLLVGAMVFALAACGGDPGTGKPPVNNDNATTPSDSGTDLEALDFGGKTLTICVSANQDYEVTFPAADRYTRGPDTASTKDEVQNAVYRRNNMVKTALNLNIEYTETDWRYDEVLNDIQKIVQVDDGSAPDIYNNDILGLSQAMSLNLLYNLRADDEGIPNYFDLEDEGWFTEYMADLTVYPETKQYIMAGDYFIDIIRMAWIFYVNIPLFNESFATYNYNVQETLYGMVRDGEWTYEEMANFANTAFRDTGRTSGVEDEEDEVIGAIIPHVSAYVLTNAGGISYIEERNGKLTVREQYPEMAKLSENHSKLFNTLGVYFRNDVLDSTKYFMNDNIIFAMSVLGEMESEEMRNLSFEKGLVPLPKFDLDMQPDYHTVTHDQAEVGAILNTTSYFTECSAYMQLINEKSSTTLNEYYENTLKLKYNDTKETREMIDLVHDTINSPKNMILYGVVMGQYSPDTVEGISNYVKTDAHNQQTTFVSKYEANRDAYQIALNELIRVFDGLQ